MSQTQKMDLLAKLKQFGLDPEEWIISQTGFWSTLLTHKNDPEFQLLGEAGPKGWKTLQLFSI